MSEELLPYYNRELAYVRKLAAQFAEAHPKIAGRLRLGPDASEDPHVERLIEAFAYLSARVRHKLDDDLPEITEALLGVLYPHYQAPVPSMAVVQFELDREQNELTAGFTLPRDTRIESEPVNGEPCRFRTCYPVTLFPIDVLGASLVQAPFPAPPAPHSSKAVACLRLTLGCRGKAVRFADLALGSLRFFLRWQAQYVYRLYELIFNNVLGVALANGADDRSPVLLGRDSIKPVGFGRDEGMLPYPARSFLGYRLLTEYFAFPEKFLFFDLANLGPKQLARVGNKLEVFLYLDRTVPDLEQNLSADVFRLGCAPMVNLYSQRAEPIPLTHEEFEYRVVPDVRRPLAHEVFSVDRVFASAPDGREEEYRPFFSVRHGAASDDETYWYASRRPAEKSGAVDRGTEVYLSLVDLAFSPAVQTNWTLNVETTCLNRDLAYRLPFGGDQPRLQLSEGGALISRISCLTPPTPTRRPALRRGALWRLISHLSLNHLSISGGESGAEALQEILKLYDFADSAETRSMIEGVLSVTSRRCVGRAAGEGGSALCRGVEVTVQFDEERFSGSGAFLFASVLERFLGLYCSINSFTRLVATVRGREGELRRWPPRAGEKVLL